MIVGGVLNFVLIQTDITGHFNYSKALDGLVRVFDLRDMLRADPVTTVFTHFYPVGASRSDRIYTTKELSDKKISAGTVAAAFTDHLSVAMRLSVDVLIVCRGKRFWKMNTSVLSEEAFKNRRGRFGVSREGSTPIGLCGGEGIQKRIRLFCIQEGPERRRDFMTFCGTHTHTDRR